MERNGNLKVKKTGVIVYPKTKVENIIDFPEFIANLKEEIIEEIGAGGDSGGGSGGGGGGEPVNAKYVYYGERNSELLIDGSISTIVNSFGKSKNLTISNVPCFSKYYYISLPTTYTLQRVVSENMETLTDLFIQKGTYQQDDEQYKLYEFHLSSDIPLDVNITITR